MIEIGAWNTTADRPATRAEADHAAAMHGVEIVEATDEANGMFHMGATRTMRSTMRRAGEWQGTAETATGRITIVASEP